MTLEHPIQQQIRIACSRGPIRLWRNNVGALRDEHGRLVRYGLCPGSADLIGLQCLPSGLGRFVALEVKRPGGRLSDAQAAWLAVVEQMGGLAGVVRSVEEAEALLRGAP